MDPRPGGPRQFITAVAALLGNAPDAQGAVELLALSEQHTGLPLAASFAGSAYGDGHSRLLCSDAGSNLIDKLPKQPARATSQRKIPALSRCSLRPVRSALDVCPLDLSSGGKLT